MNAADRPYIASIRSCAWCDEEYCTNCASNEDELKEPERYCSAECEKEEMNEVK